MIRPPRGDWRFISRNASCVHRNAPVRFVSTTARHCSSVSSSSGTAGAPMPALLKSRSRRPNLASTSAKSAATDAGSRTSHATATAPPPASAAASSSGSRPPAGERRP